MPMPVRRSVRASPLTTQRAAAFAAALGLSMPALKARPALPR